jgi:hypothetical protein
MLNQRIRKVDTEGKISTVAGAGQAGFGGDGGPAVQAALSNPAGVTFIGRATCTSPIPTTSACAGSAPMARS